MEQYKAELKYKTLTSKSQSIASKLQKWKYTGACEDYP